MLRVIMRFSTVAQSILDCMY